MRRTTSPPHWRQPSTNDDQRLPISEHWWKASSASIIGNSFLSMLSDVASGAESALEVRYLRHVERPHGLPIGTRQVGVSAHSRTDVGYLEHMVLVKLDGRLSHEGSGVWRDWKRDNDHSVSGHFTTLRYGWHDVVQRPCDIACQVAEVLTQGGWTGLLQRCRACRSVHHT